MRSVIDFERTLLGILWLFWLVYWISAAQRTAPNKRMETLLEGASYRIPLAIGVFLTAFWWMPLFLRIPALWAQSSLAAGTGSAFTVAGLCFAVWARMHLGKYWSGRISLKENHRVIQTGPYAWVRHPIYSGLILALFGTAITLGTLSAFAGFAFMLISFVRFIVARNSSMKTTINPCLESARSRREHLLFLSTTWAVCLLLLVSTAHAADPGASPIVD